MNPTASLIMASTHYFYTDALERNSTPSLAVRTIAPLFPKRPQPQTSRSSSNGHSHVKHQRAAALAVCCRNAGTLAGKDGKLIVVYCTGRYTGDKIMEMDIWGPQQVQTHRCCLNCTVQGLSSGSWRVVRPPRTARPKRRQNKHSKRQNLIFCTQPIESYWAKLKDTK
jgi:hypothetical protein